MALRDTLASMAKQVGDLLLKKAPPDKLQTARGLSMPLPFGSAGAFGVANPMEEYLYLESDLLSRYNDYDAMDEYGDLAIALDLYSQDSTQLDTQDNCVLKIRCKDKKVQKILERLFRRVLEIDGHLPELARSTAKYGSTYEELLLYPGEGVVGLHPLPPASVRRIEDVYGHHYGFVQDVHGRMGITPQEFLKLMAQRENDIAQLSSKMEAKSLNEENHPVSQLESMLGEIPFETFQYAQELPSQIPFRPWEIVHYRLRRQLFRSIYGESVLEPARWAWRRLLIMEDITMMYRLQRAPERFAFYVPTGNLPAEESLAVLKKFQSFLRRKKVVNPATGKLELRNDVISPDEDFFLPVPSEGDGPRVENLGAPQWQSLDEVNFFLQRMWAAIGIPGAYFAEEAGTSRNALSSDDVHFARKVMRIQLVLLQGLRQVAEVHLATQNIDPTTADFQLLLTVPSAIYELAQLEVRNARADLAGRMGDFFSIRWILAKVFQIPDDEIEEIIAGRRDDAIRAATTDAEGQAKAQEFLPQDAAYESRIIQKPWLREWTRPGYRLDERGQPQRRGAKGFSQRELNEGNRSLERKWESRAPELRKHPYFKERFDRLETLLQDLRTRGTRL